VRLPLLLAASVSLSLTLACAGIPTVPDRPFVAPKPSTVPLTVCWAETGRASSWGGLATSGLHSTSTWNATASLLVVKHPSGVVVIDTGKSFTLEEEMKELRFKDRVLAGQIMGPLEDIDRAPAALHKVGVEPSQLRSIIITHFHGDHAGGLADLPGAPVLLAKEEIYFATHLADAGTFHVFRDQEKAAEGRMVPIDFKPQPYEIFTQSADLFGDGSVVIVPLFGHTPGSVAVFVNAGSRRILHVGDAVVVREGFERPARKGKVLGVTDNDPESAAYQVGVLHQLHQKDPALVILPAHDRDAWQELFKSDGPTCLPPG
jgi:N-acyl homoserine lactone hydrolase